MLRKLLRTFARRSKPIADFKSKIKSLSRSIDDEDAEGDEVEVEVGAPDGLAGATGVSLQSIHLTQAQKVQQLSKMHQFEDLEDADTQAKKRYYLQQKKFASELIEKSEDEQPAAKLVQRQKKETLWGLGGELLRRKESSNN